MKKQFDYTLETKKRFDDAVESVLSETEKAGFRVLYIHDVKETLIKKGFDIEPLKIIEICNAKSAFQALQKDIRAGLCLPCKINVYSQKGKIYISGMRPTNIQIFLPNAHLEDLMSHIDAEIQSIINNSC